MTKYHLTSQSQKKNLKKKKWSHLMGCFAHLLYSEWILGESMLCCRRQCLWRNMLRIWELKLNLNEPKNLILSTTKKIESTLCSVLFWFDLIFFFGIFNFWVDFYFFCNACYFILLFFSFNNWNLFIFEICFQFWISNSLFFVFSFLTFSFPIFFFHLHRRCWLLFVELLREAIRPCW